MKKILIFFLMPLFLNAEEGQQHKHQTLGKHEHGYANLEVAVEKNKIHVSLHTPADAILGFEHKPKNKREEKILAEAKKKWEMSYGSAFKMDKKYACEKDAAEFKLDVDGKHAEVEAEIEIQCAKKFEGANLKVSLFKFWPKLGKVKIEVLGFKDLPYEKIYKKGQVDLKL